ncbi:MAG TPA: class I SAM-dependent methyltransferase, partial [Nitrospiraceae bacterium]|nr:class I SAM-dependent methyltransferase [Nitrospiraceae bacterium]
RVAERIAGAQSVLDFGCGPGILTTLYARQFPGITFVGIDRSEASVRAAREHASALGLTNVRFECVEVEQTSLSGTYDLIISTHALLQAESDPGLPSMDWRTFDRPIDVVLQVDFEERTRMSVKLDALCRVLTPEGRCIVFEKTRQLARRVPFQRAFSAREFHLLEPPLPLRYLVVEEVADDGPLYILQRRMGTTNEEKPAPWSEAPEYAIEDELYRCAGQAAAVLWDRLPRRMVSQTESRTIAPFGAFHLERGRTAGSLAYFYLKAGCSSALLLGSQAAVAAVDPADEHIAEWLQRAGDQVVTAPDLSTLPVYENHTVTAQFIWSRLADREILKTTTLEESGGRQVHVELGRTSSLIYLYWANTFDQRQIVMVEESRAPMLEQYYQEFLDGR